MTAAPWTGAAPGQDSPPPARGLAPFMSERDLQAAVIDLARLLGLLVYHTRDSRGSDPGFPDLVIVGPGGIMFAELKSQAGQLTKAQGVWRDGLRDTGVTWVLWRPEHWTCGQIPLVLRNLCARLDQGGKP